MHQVVEHVVQLMTVQANKVKHIFAPIKGKQLSVLSWDPPPDPPGVLKRKAAEQAVAEYSKKLCTLPPPPPLPAQPHSQPASDSVPQSNLPSGEASAPAGVQHTDAQQSQQQQQQQRGKAGVRADSEVRAQDASQRSDAVDMQEADVQPESSSDAGVVDFMSDDDDAESAQGPPMQAPGDVSSKHDNAQQSMHANGVAARQEATDLSRFGSDSEDGGDTDQPAGTAAVSNVAKGTNLSRFDSDDEQSALAADGFGADTTAAQQAIAPVNTSKRITDLSAFDSEDEQANSADAGADAVPSAAQQRGAGAAGSEARDTDLSRFDSGDDSSEDDDKPAGKVP